MKTPEHTENYYKVLSWLPDYGITPDGQVLRITNAITRPHGQYIVKGGDDGRGYHRVKLCLPDGSKKAFAVHRLVCEAFNGEPTKDANLCAHWDGNKRNNHFSNLRWTNFRGNSNDAIRLGERRGSRNGTTNLTELDVKMIRQQYTGAFGEISMLAKRYGLSKSGMRHICRGTNWAHVK